MHLRTTIPTKAYIAQYIQNLYGCPAKIKRDNEIGKFLYNLLEKGDDRWHAQYRSLRYGTMLHIELGEDVFLTRGCFLTKTSVTEFNNFVEDLIKSDLRSYLTAMVDEAGLQLTTAIARYYERRNFDEISFPAATITKDFQRHRIAETQKNGAKTGKRRVA